MSLAEAGSGQRKGRSCAGLGQVAFMAPTEVGFFEATATQAKSGRRHGQALHRTNGSLPDPGFGTTPGGKKGSQAHCPDRA